MIVVFTKIPLPKSQRVLYLVEEEWWKTTLGQVAVGTASVDNGRGVLASLLSCFSLLERHLQIINIQIRSLQLLISIRVYIYIYIYIYICKQSLIRSTMGLQHLRIRSPWICQ